MRHWVWPRHPKGRVFCLAQHPVHTKHSVNDSSQYTQSAATVGSLPGFVGRVSRMPTTVPCIHQAVIKCWLVLLSISLPGTHPDINIITRHFPPRRTRALESVIGYDWALFPSLPLLPNEVLSVNVLSFLEFSVFTHSRFHCLRFSAR